MSFDFRLKFFEKTHKKVRLFRQENLSINTRHVDRAFQMLGWYAGDTGSHDGDFLFFGFVIRLEEEWGGYCSLSELTEAHHPSISRSKGFLGSTFQARMLEPSLAERKSLNSPAQTARVSV